LVERILSSHSAVTSAGELQNFGICLKRSAGTRSSRVLDEETVVHGAGIDPATLGLRYLESTRPLTGRTARFTDKMPLNFFYAGFIHRALPRAKIVCLRRHPLDTCVGNYRQLFALGFHYYSYAYDLADIGRYYAAFDRLVRHWREILPADAFLEVHYEELVREQRATTERLLRFCGLPWEDACLDFHANAAPVATASSVQVRRPLYSTSIGAWRRYEKHLGPLEAALAEEGVVVDWDGPPAREGFSGRGAPRAPGSRGRTRRRTGRSQRSGSRSLWRRRGLPRREPTRCPGRGAPAAPRCDEGRARGRRPRRTRARPRGRCPFSR